MLGDCKRNRSQMRKSFMVSEAGTPREAPGFVSQVRWVVRAGHAAARGGRCGAEGSDGGQGCGACSCLAARNPIAATCNGAAKAGLAATSPKPAKKAQCSAQQYRQLGFHSAAEQRTGEKLILHQNKTEIFCVYDDSSPRQVAGCNRGQPWQGARLRCGSTLPAQPLAPGWCRCRCRCWC